MNQPPRLPIRWRLTLWYVVLLVLVMALFAGAIYVGLRQQLYAGFDEQLLNQTALTLNSVRITGGEPSMEPSGLAVGDGEYFLRLLDAELHTVLETGGNAHGVPLEVGVVTAALSGETAYHNAQDEEGETIRIVSVPVRDDDDAAVAGVLQIGLDRNEIEEPLNLLLSALALAGPAVLVLAAGGGYLLAGRALAPVATITGLAERIGAGDLSARLNLDLPDDELGRLATTFDGMLSRIEEAFERQRRFTGDAAHELRTPLSLMRAQVDLALARPRSSGEYQEALQGLDGDLERLTGLVGTLLTLARADAGRLTPSREPLDLATTLNLVMEQYAAAAKDADITMHAETVPTPLVADEDLIVQLLVNLFDNALAHTPAEGTVTAGCRPEDGQVRFWVADSGEGISPEHQPRVFDRFYRIDPGRARTRGGAGLGLAICRAIAESHGGSISLHSEVGSGTRVEVLLPSSLDRG